MTKQKLLIEQFEELENENNRLKELMLNMIRRYEARIQRARDEQDEDFKACEEYKQQLQGAKA